MLVEIVPAEAEYLVRAQVLPQNVKDVQPGQIARISLAAYDPSRYGVIMGEVRRVAKNTTQPENAMPFYETVIAIPEVVFTAWHAASRPASIRSIFLAARGRS